VLLGLFTKRTLFQKPFFVTTFVEFAKKTKINESFYKVFGQTYAETFADQQMLIFLKVLTKKVKIVSNMCNNCEICTRHEILADFSKNKNIFANKTYRHKILPKKPEIFKRFSRKL
jgi:hypothetical protein